MKLKNIFPAIDGVNGFNIISPKLPSGYQEVEYIESTGTQYIDTKYTHKATTRIEVECLINSNTNSNYQAVFGARNTNYTKNAFTFFSRFGGNNVPCFNRSGNEKTGSGLVYNEFIKIIAEGQTISWYKNDALSGSVTSTGTVDAGVNPMMIFNLNTASSSGGVTPDISYSYIKMKSFMIYEGNTLIKDFIPCYRKNDNVAGLYDTVAGTFYPNEGTGTFIIGAKVNYIGESSTIHTKYASQSMKLLITENDLEVCATSLNTFPLNSEHIYYARIEAYQEKIYGGVSIYFPIAEPRFFNQSVQDSGKWNLYSEVSSRNTFATGNYQFRIDFVGNGASLSSGEIWYDGLMLIDLTEAFGSGNEPTKEWCDANIPYFKDTYELSMVRMPNINEVYIVPNSVTQNAEFQISVIVNEIIIELTPEIRYSGEFYAGEV